MSGGLAKRTGNSVAADPEAEQPATSPVDDEKRNSTSRSQRRASTHSHKSSPLPEAAPVLEAVGYYIPEPSEKPQAGETAFEQQSSPPPTHDEITHHDEKGAHVGTEENGSAGTDPSVVQNEAENAGETDGSGEEEDEIVYPGGLQLGLLTFGLCMATFTVALDNTIIG